MAEYHTMFDEADRLTAKSNEKLAEITSKTEETRAKEIETEADRMFDDAVAMRARAAKMEERAKISAAADTRRVVEAPRNEVQSLEQRSENAFWNLIRKGENRLSTEDRALIEQRVQSSNVANLGGVTIPTTLSTAIIEAKKYAGPMLDNGLVSVLNTSDAHPLVFLTADDTANVGARVAESEDLGFTDATFSSLRLTGWKYTSRIFRVPNELLQDSGVDLAAYIGKIAGIRVGRIENEELTNGTGTNMPQGIINAPVGLTTAAANASTDDLLDLIYSIDQGYQANAKLMVNLAFVKTLRKLKSTTGEYIFNQPYLAGAPATVFAKEVVINPNLSADPKSGDVVAVYGDFTGYTRRDVASGHLVRLNELYAQNDQTGFVYLERKDGGVLDTSALRTLVAK